MSARSLPDSDLSSLPPAHPFALPGAIRKSPPVRPQRADVIEIAGLRIPAVVVSTAVAALLLGLALAIN